MRQSKKGPFLASFYLYKEMLKVYSDNIIDVVFGEGPLGFHVGELESGSTIITGCSDKNDANSNLLRVYIEFHS